jgi:hypothetical protein
MQIINPLDISRGSLPLFVFSDDMRSFMGWMIKSHSKGNWNHIMMMINPGKVVTQGGLYHEIPITEYMKPNIRLKFWQYRNLPIKNKEEIIRMIYKELHKPIWLKWTNWYDWIGIIGQGLGKIHPIFRKINNPWQRYCSERVRPRVAQLPINKKFLNENLSQKPAPGEINQFFKKIDEMIIFGYWDKDLI